ncbi:GNAT family N-acetyltransferase [Streptomyces sp. NPDC049881]|uniref:GNAT family N-acetyltransferase n=1 Tax=Streptomyces sp. NPDC049881 TaxID=3155778 RepID=UPI00341B2EE7
MSAVVRQVSAARLLAETEGVRRVYRDAFCTPPWNETPERADAYARRLTADTARPGFTAALAQDTDGSVLGFATAWTTPSPFPGGRCYPRAAEAVGAARVAPWLCGAREIDELAVRPAARGRRLGAALLAAVADAAPGGRCWLLTSARNPAGIAFYRRAGWTQVNRPVPEETGFVVFLGPAHPARSLVRPR